METNNGVLEKPKQRSSTISFEVEGGMITFNPSDGSIVAADKTITEAVIPAMIGGYQVKRIGNYAFYGCNQLKRVVIAEGITAVNANAFDYCLSLTEVQLPDSIERLEDYAFVNCGIKEIVPGDGAVEAREEVLRLPRNIKYLGGKVFLGCRNLERVVWPEEYVTIPNQTFDGCTELKEVVLPDSLKLIREYAFQFCRKLKEVRLPESLAEMGYHAFRDTGIEICRIPKMVKCYQSGGDWFYGCAGLKEIILEEGMKTIPRAAFAAIPAKIKIELPDSIESIEDYAFANSGITEIIPKEEGGEAREGVLSIPRGIKSFGSNVFTGCQNLERVVWPEEYETVPRQTFDGCGSLAEVVLPDSLKLIREYAFQFCRKLKEVRLPEGLAEMGYHAFRDTSIESCKIPKMVKCYQSGGDWFYGCLNLKQIILEEGMTTIPRAAFAQIPGTIKIELPDSIEIIEDYAFAYSGITEIIPKEEGGETREGVLRIPRGIKSFGSNVFIGCQKLERVVWPEEYETVPRQTFDGCGSLAEVVLPDSLKLIREYAFQFCPKLKEIRLPEGLAEMGYHAFRGIGIESCRIPRQVTNYQSGGDWFYGCADLKEIVLEEGMRTIPRAAFAQIHGKIKIELPDSIEIIEDYAFAYSGIMEIIPKEEGAETREGVLGLPRGIKSFGNNVFIGCQNLERVVWPEEYEIVPGQTFDGCGSLAEVVLPDSLKLIREYAFQFCRKLKEVRLPEGLEEMGYHAFRDTGIESCKIPKMVKCYQSGGDWFYGCLNLKQIILEEGMTTIPRAAFAQIPGTIKIELPDSIENIEDYAFAYSGITEIVPKDETDEVREGVLRLPRGLKTLGNKVFIGCKKLERVVWPEEYEVMPNETFHDCPGLREVILPKGLKAIKDYAFQFCSNLREVRLPEGLTGIGYHTFRGTSIESINIPKTVKTHGGYFSSAGYWFYGCSTLKEVVMEDGLEAIPANAFAEIQVDFDVYVPDSVTAIEDRAFYNCKNLTKLQLTEHIEYTGRDIFKGCDKLQLSFPMNYHLINHVIDNRLKYVVIEGEEFISHGIVNPEQSFYQKSVNQLNVNGYAVCTVQYQVSDTEFKKISDAKVRIRIPNSTTLFEGSIVLNGSKTPNYEFADQWIVIPVSAPEGIIHFTVQQTSYDRFISFASLNYLKDYQRYDDLIGYLYTEVPPISINAPSITGKSVLSISGVSLPDGDVCMFVDGLLTGTVKANKSGSYEAVVSLGDTDNKKHNLEVHGKDVDGQIHKASAIIKYNSKWPEITFFEMGYRLNNMVRNIDLLSTVNEKVIVNHNYNHPFTFSVKFSDDSIVRKLYVCSTKDGVKKLIEAKKNSVSGVWSTEQFFDNGNHNYTPGKIKLLFLPDIRVVPLPTPEKKISYLLSVREDEIDVNNFDKYTKEEQAIIYNYLLEMGGDAFEQDDDTVISEILDKLDTAKGYIDDAIDLLSIRDSEIPFEERMETLTDLLSSYALDAAFPVPSVSHQVLLNVILRANMNSYYTMKKICEVLDELKEDAESLAKAGKYEECLEVLKQLRVLLIFFIEAFKSLDDKVDQYLGDLRRLNKDLPNNDYDKDYGDKNEYPQDPQGYVYEAVTTNRLAGVIASVYYQDEVNGKVKLWNASEYNQKNNQVTDETGVFAWDVPPGLWQVKCILEGYELAESGWLPVPPPQLDVKIPMVSDEVPVIISAKKQNGDIVVQFSKYMQPESVKNVKLTDLSGTQITYALEYSDAEKDHYDHVFAREFKLKPDNTSAVYKLQCGLQVTSYAGAGMTDKVIEVR